MQLLDQLAELPDDWGLVAVGRNKRPYQDGWQRNPLDKGQAAAEIVSGRAKAIGVLAGPLGGGLMFLDHDGPSAAEVMTRIGAPLDSLPRTVAVTSGRRGRFQLVFRVPERYWTAMVGRRVLKSGQIGSDGKAEQVELRWEDHQSVVIGAHPQTKGYRWLPGQAPADLPVAEAPLVLIEQLLPNPEPEPAPLFDAMPPPPSRAGVLPLLEFVTRDSRDLVESGGTPGSWNDDQLRLSLDLIGTEDWIRAQGHQADMTARDAFAMHVAAAAGKARDFDEKKAWHRFDGAASRNPKPGTPEQKLRDRVAFHTRSGESTPPTDHLVEITEDPQPKPPPRARSDGSLRGMPFRCLGYDHNQYFYMPDHARQVVQLSPAQHSKNFLISIAPLSCWESSFGFTNEKGETVINWTAATDAMIGGCIQEGVYDASRLRGRGAWVDQDRAIFHLGDRMIVDGEATPVASPPGSRFFYEQGWHMDGPSDSPMPDDVAAEIRDISERFNWEIPASSTLLLGWIALAPVCGALDWRPHAWVTGGAGTGKTTVLAKFSRPLLGGIYQAATGGTTEAGLRGLLRSDAIPVVFDEFEPNTMKDKTVVQNVLQLARIASSDGGKIYKGTASGGSIGYEIRSMFLVCSINVALVQKADVDRFCVLSLIKPLDSGTPQCDARWKALEERVERVCTVANGRALVARTLSNLKSIVANSRTFGSILAQRFGQRFGDQHGPLLAGAWSLEAHGGMVVDRLTAEQWIDQMDWDQAQPDVTEAEEIKCRNMMLQQLVRYGSGGDQASLGEIVRSVVLQSSLADVTHDQLPPTLGRYGLRVFRAGQVSPGQPVSVTLQGDYLAVASSNAQLQHLLSQTPWSNSYQGQLKRIAGAIVPPKPIHFAGIGSSRCVLIPVDSDDIERFP